MLTIRCAKCKQKIFKYRKIGKGRVLHCWQDRIVKDFSIRKGSSVECPCGNKIGIDQGRWVKMWQGSFVYTGTKTAK